MRCLYYISRSNHLTTKVEYRYPAVYVGLYCLVSSQPKPINRERIPDSINSMTKDKPTYFRALINIGIILTRQHLFLQVLTQFYFKKVEMVSAMISFN